MRENTIVIWEKHYLFYQNKQENSFIEIKKYPILKRYLKNSMSGT